ncbi:hypothetical protein PS947_04210 [Pseudomonas fluorescens]|nr:hypothetical protein PS947_04210 [Pseudomonas fluorescens]
MFRADQMHHLLAAPAGVDAVVEGQVAVGNDAHRHHAVLRKILIDFVAVEGKIEVGVAVITGDVVVFAGAGEFDQQFQAGSGFFAGMVLAGDLVVNVGGITVEHKILGQGEGHIPIEFGLVLNGLAPHCLRGVVPKNIDPVANAHGEPGRHSALQPVFHATNGDAAIVVFRWVERVQGGEVEGLQGIRCWVGHGGVLRSVR